MTPGVRVRVDHIAVIGGGAIGGYLAAQLAWAGKAVTLCVRTPIERLEIEEGGKIREVPVRIAAGPGGLAKADWILVATKAQDTAGAAPWMRALAGPGTMIAVVQNGIDHAARVQAIAGAAQILPCIIYCGAEQTRRGHVVHHAHARLIVPEGSPADGLAALFAGTSFEVVQDADFTTSAWRKLLANLAANPITALTLRRAEVLRESAIQALATGLLHEAVRVAQAEGAKLTAADADRIVASFATSQSGGGSSMLYDRRAGRPLEHAFITGAVVDAAARHGIDVPLNRAILALLDAVSGRPLVGAP